MRPIRTLIVFALSSAACMPCDLEAAYGTCINANNLPVKVDDVNSALVYVANARKKDAKTLTDLEAILWYSPLKGDGSPREYVEENIAHVTWSADPEEFFENTVTAYALLLASILGDDY